MDKFFETAPNIIQQAAQSPLGLLALMILALSVLGYFFFRDATERTRTGIFVLMVIGVASFAFATIGTISSSSNSVSSDSSDKTGAKKAAVPSIPLSLSGEWDVFFSNGHYDIFTLRQNDQKITGTLPTHDGTHGELEGNIIGPELKLRRDTGLDTIQWYNLRIVSRNELEGTYWNEGKYPDRGTIKASRKIR